VIVWRAVLRARRRERIWEVERADFEEVKRTGDGAWRVRRRE